MKTDSDNELLRFLTMTYILGYFRRNLVQVPGTLNVTYVSKIQGVAIFTVVENRIRPFHT
jgi:hypothetical protein